MSLSRNLYLEVSASKKLGQLLKGVGLIFIPWGETLSFQTQIWNVLTYSRVCRARRAPYLQRTLVSQQRLGYDELLHLRSALVNLSNFGVAQETFYRILFRVAVTTVNLNRV